MKTLLSALTLAAATGGAAAAPTFAFSFIAGTPLQAQQGFTDAAARWSALLDDDVTIHLTVGFNPLDPGILGQARSAQQLYSYDTFRTALAADVASDYDTRAVGSLAGGSTFGMLLNRTANSPSGPGSATPFVDHDGDANNAVVRIATAQAKALGLAPARQTLTGCLGPCDGFIQFSSHYQFDFDPHDGISADAFDFVGVAAHEIGHSLGFISGVDVLDFNSSAPDFFDDSAFTYVSGLDLFRYSMQSHAAGVPDWTADERAKYLSLDGGLTAVAPFSTGIVHGDGRQASHWRDDLFIGLMDPTAGLGELLDITQNDLVAMDVIGWDVPAVPEPGTAAMLAGGLLLVGQRRGLFRKSTK
ncbi:NF038122 family metalloprotease [Pseudoduganella chitinolytica]|uniref:NF038122 family metalloprotease n=1 Tax=Pseudoduganella chitinolytica TaxID=34070 RepID=A0ABY8BGW8_9BURK|nr:NF038122 family metalloprotease [Pseudoduganella chitinolytica]WEF35172.1 NF038122 family metalloprotease [Pseudoduganella chitinolytica]